MGGTGGCGVTAEVVVVVVATVGVVSSGKPIDKRQVTNMQRKLTNIVHEYLIFNSRPS